jgi:adenosylhomocysteine nucleosidase
MIGIFAAMDMEVSGLRRRLAVTESVRVQGCRAERCRHGDMEVLLVRFGMGRARAQVAVDTFLPHYPLSAVLSLGFAGALVPGLDVGDIVLCSAVCYYDTGADSRVETLECDPKLLSLAASLPSGRFRVTEGLGVTTDAFVSRPEAKRTLAATANATAVDMESYWIAKGASALGLPFLSVRTISDAPATRLPPVERFIDADGRWRWRSMAAHCLVRPQDLVGLLSLGRAAFRARAGLTAFADALLGRMAAEKADGGSHIHRARSRVSGHAG